jgi:hypothetical protein
MSEVEHMAVVPTKLTEATKATKPPTLYYWEDDQEQLDVQQIANLLVAECLWVWAWEMYTHCPTQNAYVLFNLAPSRELLEAIYPINQFGKRLRPS